jgi:antirestriction protein ArdC
MSTFPDLYASVTERIITALEAGTPPWICPWHGAGVDGRPAGGINVLLLNLRAMSCGYARSRWLTFQQALAVGGCVRRGEQGTQVVFFKMHEFDRGDAEPSQERRVVPLLRAFTVFNIDQVEGLPEALTARPATPAGWEPLEVAEAILGESGAEIRHGGSRAFYAPDPDLIHCHRAQPSNAAATTTRRRCTS